MGRTVIGLDIGANAVRAAQLTLPSGKGNGRPTLTRFAQVALPAGAMADGEIVDADAVADAIGRLWTSGGFDERQVIVGITGERVMVRQAELPAMSDEELSAALSYQAAELIPLPVDDCILDFCVLDRFSDSDGEERMRILLAAAQRDVVEQYLNAVERAGLHAKLVDLASLGLLRSVSGEFQDVSDWQPGAEAIVSVGSEITHVVVHEHGVLRFARTLKLGGADLTHALATELNISDEKAEWLKRRADRSSTNDAYAKAGRVLENQVGGLAENICASLDYYFAQPDSTTLVRVLVTGGAATTPGLIQRLERRVGCSVLPARPYDRVIVGDLGLDDADAVRTERVVAIPLGLALAGITPMSGGTARRRMSLLPPEVMARQAERRQRVLAIIAFAMVAVLLGALTFVREQQVRDARESADDVQAKVLNFQTQLQANQGNVAVQAEIVKRLALADAALKGEPDHSRLVQEVATVLPADVWFSSIQIERGAKNKPGQLTISAEGTSPSSAASWLDAACRIPGITKVWVGTASDNGDGGVRFDSSAELTTAAESKRAKELRETVLPTTTLPATSAVTTTTSPAGTERVC